MNKDEVLKELGKIESDIGCKSPVLYKKFLSEEVGGADAYEFTKKNGEVVCIFNYKDLVERNDTYSIQESAPDSLLIGQDGDLGYFINLNNGDDKIYSLDLGALGSLNMDEEGKDLYSLRM
ncbi:SMI1/KNR4 family protein [Serratia marcescens]|uniref:SMI1/KNR4 family protein n=1 Tax=Serratia marcescens TaxID=615 RepID=UPI00277B0FDD|nr:SMI1/KNR4 family protein [Serratia marcescens]MDP8773469.1 SMI1/KNR4 family protein [Serratia marcescens]MDP8803876.1 SMI1/KNR4 family protein [Serratia marcescens]